MNIIIVGNGKSVLDSLNGEIINSFDYVVRLNRYVIQNYERYVGTKTSCIALSFSAYTEYIKSNVEVFKEYKQNSKQLLIDLYHSYKRQNMSKQEIKSNLNKYKQNNLYVKHINNNPIFHLLLFNQTKTPTWMQQREFIPNTENYSTGFAAIKYFTDKNHTVTITGFDFFKKSSCYWLQTFDVFDEKRLIEDRTKKDGHPYSQEELMVSKLILAKKVKILK